MTLPYFVIQVIFFPLQSDTIFYALCVLLGFGAGYWALFVTIAAEQFGTNLRATVATTVPNFVRGSVILMTPLFLIFKEQFGILRGAGLVGLLCIAIALAAILFMEETFGKDLNFLEEEKKLPVLQNMAEPTAQD